MRLIAEVKTHSPFGWESDKSWEELFDIAKDIGHTISVHTHPAWDGSFDLITKAKALTDKPILAKGIHPQDDDIRRAIAAGADQVLVVGRWPGAHVEQCLIEPGSIEELQYLPPNVNAVWNSRDLATGGLKKEDFDEARNVFSGWLCQASNIDSPEQVNPSADAILVGTHLPEFAARLQS